MSLEIVKNFLNALEDRNLSEAKKYLSPSPRMIFPGGIDIKDLNDLVEWSKKRYKYVKKSFGKFDAIHEGDTVTIYSLGTLDGIANDGKEIKNVRYVDRFVIEEDKIINIQVWNDLAESILIDKRL